MGSINKVVISIASAAVLISSCATKEEHLFDNKLYIKTDTGLENLLFSESKTEVSESRTITLGVPFPAESPITGTFAYDSLLCDRYNAFYSQTAEGLPAAMVEIASPDAEIVEGAVSSTPVVVTFKGIEKLDRKKVYVAPVKLVNVKGCETLQSKSIVYYIFKGASLINVVADIAENYFPISWQSDVSKMTAITVEALIRVRDFKAIPGKKGEGMSTIFGIEGGFLVRIGDASFPENQIQLVNPNGNFPSPNPDLGLPTNEWVHIAVVWSAESGDRIIYHNGIEMARDQRASGSFSLASGCFIGKAWNDERWLDGEIAEVRIWNIQRSQSEIAENIYTVDPESEGLVAYWKFNEGSGNTIMDHTGNGNNITANSDLGWTNVSLPE